MHRMSCLLAATLAAGLALPHAAGAESAPSGAPAVVRGPCGVADRLVSVRAGLALTDQQVTAFRRLSTACRIEEWNARVRALSSKPWLYPGANASVDVKAHAMWALTPVQRAMRCGASTAARGSWC